MLSVFPDLYNYSNFLPVLLRLFLGLYLLRAAWGNYTAIRAGLKPNKAAIWTLIKSVGGIFILAGYLIQPTAMFFGLLALCVICFKSKLPGHRGYPTEFYILLVLAYLTLVVLGPGIWSIDLPL